MWIIGTIDKDHNGYVTKNELDDILKLHYKEQLGECNLYPIINRFCSISNKILIDYNRFRQWMQKEIFEFTVPRTKNIPTKVFQKMKL